MAFVRGSRLSPLLGEKPVLLGAAENVPGPGTRRRPGVVGRSQSLPESGGVCGSVFLRE